MGTELAVYLWPVAMQLNLQRIVAVESGIDHEQHSPKLVVKTANRSGWLRV